MAALGGVIISYDRADVLLTFGGKLFLVVRLMRNWLKSRWIHAWVFALVGALDILDGTAVVALFDISYMTDK